MALIIDIVMIGLSAIIQEELRFVEVFLFTCEFVIKPITFELNKDSEKIIDDWLNTKNADIRKHYLNNVEFNLYNV